MFVLDIIGIFVLVGLPGQRLLTIQRGILMADKEATLHLCRCKERSTVHVHCSCEICEGKAVSVSTAWRHGNNSRNVSSVTSGNQETSPDDSNTLIFDSSNFQEITIDDTTKDDDLSCYTSDDSESMDFSSGHDVEDFSDNDIFSYMYDSDDFDFHSTDLNSSTSTTADPQMSTSRDFSQFVEEAILKLVDIKAQNGFSIKAFEQLLNWGKGLNEMMDNLWPTKWEHVTRLLQQLGYKEAKCYWICLDPSHKCNYSLANSKSDICKYCGKQPSIPFYYLSVIDKVKRWCRSPSMCKKMTAHWQEKDHWFANENTSSTDWGWIQKKEIWDGKRFAELAYFWNPDDEWVLPVYCPNSDCNTVISATEVINSPTAFGKQSVTCPSCFNQFETEIKTTTGDPRNIAYIGI